MSGTEALIGLSKFLSKHNVTFNFQSGGIPREHVVEQSIKISGFGGNASLTFATSKLLW